MAKKNVTVIFDRLDAVKKTGRGKVEIRVYLSRDVRKYIVVGETTKKWLEDVSEQPRPSGASGLL